MKYFPKALFLLFLYVLAAFAQDIKIDSKYYLDQNNSLSIDNIYANKDKFVNLKKDDTSFGLISDTLWIYLKVENLTEQPLRNIVQFQYPLIDYIYILEYDNKKIIDKYLTGDLTPYDTRKIKTNDFVIPYTVNPYKTKELILKINSDGALNVGMNLLEHTIYEENASTNKMILGIYYGAVLIMLIYNFILFLIIKDRMYIDYVIFHFVYLFLQLGFNGLAFEYFWPTLPQINLYFIPIMLILASYFSIQFSLSFLELKKINIRIYKYFKILMFLLLMLIAVFFMTSYAFVIKIIAALSIISVSSMLVVGIYLLVRYRTTSSKFYVTAWSFLLTGVLLTDFQNVGILPMNFFTFYGTQIGAFFELALLSFALAYRYNSLYSKLVTTETDLKFLNKDLENKVIQRTEVLNEKIREEELQKQKISAILDAQPYMIILTNEKTILEVNHVFIEFFPEYKSLKDFLNKHDCICEFFENPKIDDNYLYGKDSWSQLIATDKHTDLKVAMTSRNRLHHFAIKTKNIYLKNNNERFNIITFIDVTEEIEHSLKVEKHKNALLHITKQSYKDIQTTLDKALELSTNTLLINRVSIWLYNENHTAIVCTNLYSNGNKANTDNLKLEVKDNPEYFNSINDGHAVVIYDAQNDVRTKSFAENYLKPLNIASMLDIPIIKHGEIIGVVCNEHSKKIWSAQDIEFSTAIANNVALSLEIEQRKNTELLLSNITQDQNSLLSLFDKGDVSLFKWKNDENWNVEYVSKNVSTIFGYSRNDFTNYKIIYKNIIHKDDINRVEEERNYAIDENLDFFVHKPYRICTNDSQIKWVLDNTLIVKDDKGNTIHSLGYIVDVTDLKEYENKLEYKVQKSIKETKEKEKMIQQQSKLTSMGEMIRNIAHQWRQPLSQINSAVLILDTIVHRKDFKDDMLDDKLTEIESLTKYMSKTIDDFQSFFKPDKKKETFILQEVLQKSIQIIQGSLVSKNIELNTKLNQDYKYNGFPHELQHVIIIVINNAIDALIDKEIKNPKITIEFQEDSEHYHIFICDNANGINEEIIDKIFEPYFTTKHKSQGTGLGLYVSKMIIEDGMGGELNVKNKNGGVCFNISLPRKSK